MISLHAPAKINWYLYVTGKRPDGYHSLSSILQSISIYDHITIERSESIELQSDCNIPTNENLVYKAAVLLKGKKSSQSGALIRLSKNIPLQAGLGGGSSDAAFTLIGLNRLWRLGLTTEELSNLSSELGSDVPFFVNGSFGSVSGRGESVSPLEAPDSFELLLVKPPVPISTAWAYGKIGGFSAGIGDNYPKDFLKALNQRDFDMLKILMKNDIQEAIRDEMPFIDEIKGALICEGAEVAMLSGSGSTVFGVFNGGVAADKACEKLKNKYPDYWISRAVTIN